MLDRIDGWKSNWNFLAATRAQRLTALIEVGIASLLWITQGWDSGFGQYGTSLHYSVFVIYGLEYALLNWWLDTTRQIRGIRNLILSVTITIGSVALFEWYWGFGYALFHGETWVLTPSNEIYTELIAISIIGILGLLYGIYLGIPPQIDRLTFFLLLPALFWWMIGFPQTCYPSVNGTILYIENNLIHLHNILAKLGMALATARIILN